MNKTYSLAAIICIITAIGGIAQDSTTSEYPYYVKVVHAYTYPGTQWTSSPGEVEQAIAETPEFYIVTTSIGTSLQLPKSIAARITEKEAARLLMAERKMHHDEYSELLKQSKQMAAAIQKQNAGSSSSTSEMREQIKLLQDIRNLNKSPDKRPIPNRNRYEVEVR